ncbi:MAG TPA: acylneuraminate cytidylyltransferase family protein [Steroidobacteraceae bacterium]|nr:acylneuraminate cytidylyltransferase family protein [Steroidobacteraceae bacterium]
MLALIPARAGSKRLPGKNKRLLGGKPLIAWSLEVARDTTEICDVLVSTDDPEIAQIAQQAGALVPWLRPPSLATDTATSVDVAAHALEWYRSSKSAELDGLLLLQPTSPFRRRETVRRGLELFARNADRAVVGVSSAHPHPQWCFRIEHGVLKPYVDASGLQARSQDLPAAYAVNGALYLIAPELLFRERTFVPEGTLPLVLDDPMEAVDIDTQFDWEVAEAVCTMRRMPFA